MSAWIQKQKISKILENVFSLKRDAGYDEKNEIMSFFGYLSSEISFAGKYIRHGYNHSAWSEVDTRHWDDDSAWSEIDIITPTDRLSINTHFGLGFTDTPEGITFTGSNETINEIYTALRHPLTLRKRLQHAKSEKEAEALEHAQLKLRFLPEAKSLIKRTLALPHNKEALSSAKGLWFSPIFLADDLADLLARKPDTLTADEKYMLAAEVIAKAPIIADADSQIFIKPISGNSSIKVDTKPPQGTFMRF